jgi:NADPH-dependent 2,4-dienoyl-CoA reductase/sulfur reductase-like enzyme
VTERLVVIGGDAAGMSAASQAKRLRKDDLEVIAFERGTSTSYSACGIPYWIGGQVGGMDELVARTPAEHRKNGIDVRVRHEVIDLDLDARTVRVRDLDSDRTERVGFDQVMIATGATPFRPPIDGLDGPDVYGVQTLDDGDAVLKRVKGRWKAKKAIIVGGGYIGIEMAEALVRRDLEVTLVDSSPAVMSTLDPDMGRLVEEAMTRMGIDVQVETRVQSISQPTGAGARVRVHTSDGDLDADLVVLGLGVRPNTQLAEQAGLPLGDHGGLLPDLRMRVPGADGVWAAGDCVEVINKITGRWSYVPLGTHANKQGRTAGTNIGGGYAIFPGVVGTAMSGVCDLEIARTGLRTAEAEEVGLDVVSQTIESTTRAGYYPGAAALTVKVIAERSTGRLVGVQIIGREDAGKRIDAAAVAVWHGMTVAEVANLDLGYAPPFAPVWDPLLIAARKVAESLSRG